MPKVFENLGWVALRGAILGFCHLTVFNKFMSFVEQPQNPFGMQAINLDAMTRKFINQEVSGETTQGDELLMRLSDSGYFDQGRDSVSSSIYSLE